MKRMFFLMLTLMVLSVASMNAQVRIGGTDNPNSAAALDLNATDDVDNGILGLALPRVNFNDPSTKLNGLTPTNGMMVYNTNITLGEGVYFWTGGTSGHWVNVSEVADNSVNTTSIVNGSITGDKLAQMNATPGTSLQWDGTAWSPARTLQIQEYSLTIPAGKLYVRTSWTAVRAGACADAGIRAVVGRTTYDTEDGGQGYANYRSAGSVLDFYRATTAPLDVDFTWTGSIFCLTNQV